MKFIPPNSCVFCEIAHDKHGSRLDGLHPRGVWTWVEPSDKLRLERMRRNRILREENAMTSRLIAADKWSLNRNEWLTMEITYKGKNRVRELGNGQIFKVVDTRHSGNGGSIDAVAVDAGIFGTQWINISSVEIVTDTNYTEIVSNLDFLDPHKGTIEALDAKIKLLEEQLTEARLARKVIAGL